MSKPHGSNPRARRLARNGEAIVAREARQAARRIRANEERHTCPAPACDEQLPVSVFACRAHWFTLPLELREKLSRAWRQGGLAEYVSLHEQAVAILRAP